MAAPEPEEQRERREQRDKNHETYFRSQGTGTIIDNLRMKIDSFFNLRRCLLLITYESLLMNH